MIRVYFLNRRELGDFLFWTVQEAFEFMDRHPMWETRCERVVSQ